MATTSTGLSSPGIGSGLDVNSIVTQLVSLERRPITALQTGAQRIQTQISGMGQLQSLTSGLRDAASALAKEEAFETLNVSSSDTSALTATVTSGGSPAVGSYIVATTSLAGAQTTASAASDYLSSTALAGSGTLTISLGSWDSGLTSFTPKAGATAVDITVEADDTLAEVRDKINAANAGVSAAIVTDSTGARLTLRSLETGASNGFRVTTADDDGQHTDAAGLSRLAFDPPTTTRTTRTMAAADAVISVNGVELRSATNTFEGAIDGMTLTAAKAPASNVTLTVGANTESVKQLVSRFVAAYNALAKFMSAQTRYNAETQQAGIFQGDSGVVSLYNRLRSMVSQDSYAASSLRNLSSVGIELQKDGTLQVNNSRLESALKNLPQLAAALSADVAGQPMLSGSMVRIKGWADGLLESTGTLPGRTKSLQSQLQANQRRQEQLEDRVAAVEKRLRAQYTALDSTMSRASALSSYVSQQITALENFNSASSS